MRYNYEDSTIIFQDIILEDNNDFTFKYNVTKNENDGRVKITANGLDIFDNISADGEQTFS